MAVRYLLIGVLLLFFSSSFYGQNSRLDSLKNEWSNCKGKDCVKVIVDLCWASREEPIDSIEKYVELGKIVLKEHPDLLSLVDLNFIMVMEQYDNDLFLDGIETAKNALPIAFEAKDTLRIFDLYRMMMVMYGKQSSNAEVVELSATWDLLADSLNMPKQKANGYSYLANYYRNQGQNEKSLEYIDKAIETFETIDYPYGLHLAYLRKGLVYSNLGDDESNLEYLNKSFDVYGSQMNANDSALINDNVGRALRKLGRYKEGEPYLLSSIRQSNSTGWMGNTIHAMNELMDLYYEDGQYDKALKIGEELYEMSRGYQNIRGKVDITRNLSEIYAAVGRFSDAYDLRLEHSVLIDSIYNLDADQIFAEMDAKFKTAQKDKEIAEQALEIEKKQNARNLLLGLLGLILFLGASIYWWMRNRLRLKQREKEKLEEIDQLKTDFFANISHELRTPLTLINGPVNQVLEETKNASHKKLMQLAVKNSNKLKHLINQLLDFSKVEAGKVRIKKKEHDIIAFAKGILMSFESLAEKRGVKLQFFSYDHDLKVAFDEDMMEKVLSNLLSNALKFTKANGEVKLMVAANDDKVEMTVQDSGIGIAEDELPYVFDRFYVAEHSISKEYEGTGIGLSLVKDLVELHDGSVGVTSTLNKGTTFNIVLPKSTSDETPAETLSEDRLLPSVKPESMVGVTLSIEPSAKAEDLPVLLIIEDNEDVRFFIAQRLMNQFQIIEAKDGVEGIEKAMEHVPDLIICDIMMPRKNGYEVTGELKSRVETSHIPIILLTAKATREEKLEGLGQGADDYLIKPFDSKELQIKTNNIIESNRKIQSYLSDHLVSESSRFVKNSVDKQFLEDAYKILEENLAKDQFGVEDFARQIGMSSTNLNRKFRALADQSSNQFIQSYRIKRAAQMLKGRTGNVSEIAMEVGFSSNSYFIKVFKTHYGMTPNEYMNQDE